MFQNQRETKIRSFKLIFEIVLCLTKVYWTFNSHSQAVGGGGAIVEGSMKPAGLAGGGG